MNSSAALQGALTVCVYIWTVEKWADDRAVGRLATWATGLFPLPLVKNLKQVVYRIGMSPTTVWRASAEENHKATNKKNAGKILLIWTGGWILGIHRWREGEQWKMCCNTIVLCYTVLNLVKRSPLPLNTEICRNISADTEELHTRSLCNAWLYNPSCLSPPPLLRKTTAATKALCWVAEA